MTASIRDMTGEEIALFADVVHNLASPDLNEDPRDKVSDQLLKLMRCKTLASYVWEPDKKRYTTPVYVNQDSALIDAYVKDLQFSDPVTKHMATLRGARIVENSFPAGALRRTEFYHNFLRPEGMYHGINVFVDAGNGQVVDLRLWRGRNGKPFEKRDIDLLDTISGYFSKAVRNAKQQNIEDPLTAREREVAQLVARGCTDTEIGNVLGIGFPTVRTHVNRCFDKLGVSNRTELSARYASTLSRRL